MLRIIRSEPMAVVLAMMVACGWSQSDAGDTTGAGGQGGDAGVPESGVPESGVPDSAEVDAEAPMERVNSVTRHGVTWHFDKEYDVAQFINGDWAVVAPGGVRVTAVDPAPQNGINGSGVNLPAGAQPADSRGGMSGYDAGLAVTFPKDLVPGDAMVSFVSLSSADSNCTQGTTAGYQNVMGYCERLLEHAFVKGASVLTVMDRRPAMNEFRPSALGDASNRKVYTMTDIDAVVSALPRLGVASMYDIAELIRTKERFQYEAIGGWQRRFSAPADNQATYAAYSLNPEALLALAADYPLPDKRKLLIGVVQHGIELEGAARVGAIWAAEGGHATHQVSVIAVTAALLKDPSFASVKTLVSGAGEKAQTYYGQNQVALWGQACSGASAANFEAQCLNNNYQSGAKDCRDPDGLYDELTKPPGVTWACVQYQTTNGPYYAGQALAMRLLGAMDHFDHPAFFDYTDRWMTLADTAKTAFAEEMWKAHRY